MVLQLSGLVYQSSMALDPLWSLLPDLAGRCPTGVLALPLSKVLTLTSDCQEGNRET